MTGVLYASVVAMWIAVVVPTYLKRHDRRELERSLASPLTEQLERRRAAWAARPPLSPRQRAFIRRRRTLMALLTALVFTALLAATDRIPWFVVLAPLSGTSAFIRAAARAATAPRRRAPAQVRTAPAAAPAAPEWHHTTVAVPLPPTVNPRAWRPTAPVLPSYLTAEPARPVEQRAWTGEELLAEAAVVRQQRSDRIREAQAQFEQARAQAMERARQAALDASLEHEAYRGQRAVND